MTKVVFIGTGVFGAHVLRELTKVHDVSLVVSKPELQDKRGMLHDSAVHILAKSRKLNIVTPEKLAAATEDIKHVAPDIIVVTDYGKIIPSSMFSLSPKGILNVHPSLLPLHRGPCPIESSILTGDLETGVSVMVIDEEMDHGPLLLQKTVGLDGTETTSKLTHTLGVLGGKLLNDSIAQYLNETLQPKVQDHAGATYCEFIKKSDGDISESNSDTVLRKLRAYDQWPGTFLKTNLNGKERMIRIITLNDSSMTKQGDTAFFWSNDNLFLNARDRALIVTKLQVEGGSVMDAKSFYNGYKVDVPTL